MVMFFREARNADARARRAALNARTHACAHARTHARTSDDKLDTARIVLSVAAFAKILFGSVGSSAKISRRFLKVTPAARVFSLPEDDICRDTR